MGDAAEDALAALSVEELVTCPICEQRVPLAGIDRHIDMGCPLVGAPPREHKEVPPKPSAPAVVPTAPVADFPVTVKKKPPKGNAKAKPSAHIGAAAKPHPKPQATAPAEAFPALGAPIDAFPSLSSVAKAPSPLPASGPQPPSQSNLPQPPPAKAELPPPPPPSDELRIDPADGSAYTRADFVAEYGGTREWDQARPVAPAAPAPGGWGSKPAAALFSSAIAGSAPPRPSPAMTAAAAAQATAAAQSSLESAPRRFSQLTLEELYEERLVKAPVLHPPRPRSFELQELVQGKRLNSLQGLALHAQVLSAVEQQLTLLYCHRLKDLGDDGALVGRTYSAPRKWRKGNGRVTVQMGCCYNYATDKDGHPPGILPHEPVCGMPPFLEDLIDRMVSRGIFTSRTRPDSCIINFYSEGDCIPPHIDHHDFTRPFVTLSLLSEQSILFGSTIDILNEGEFAAPFSCALPVGSVLVLDGNGANVAKHCVPSVSADRISITFRKINAKLKGKMAPGFHGPHGEAPPQQRR